MKTDKSYPLAFTIGVVRVILMTRLKNYADKVECVSPDYFVLTFSEHEVQIKLSETNAGTSLIISSENDKTPSPDEIYFELVNCGLKMEREKAANRFAGNPVKCSRVVSADRGRKFINVKTTVTVAAAVISVRLTVLP